MSSYRLLVPFIYQIICSLQTVSTSPYIYHQISFFQPSSTVATISSRAGLLQGSFVLAKSLSSIHWADQRGLTHRRKRWILCGALVAIGLSSLALGYPSNLWQAILWRLVSGLASGTDVLARQAIWEVFVREGQTTSLTNVLVLSSEISWLLAGLLGGLPLILEDRSASHDSQGGPHLFHGYPFALPGLFNCALAGVTMLIVVTCLDRPLPEAEEKVENKVRREHLPESVHAGQDTIMLGSSSLAHFHLSAFAIMCPLFLSSPTSTGDPTSIFKFTGGLGFPAVSVGIAMSITSALVLSARAAETHKWTSTAISQWQQGDNLLWLFPLAYFLAQYLAVVSSSRATPNSAAGFPLWFDVFVLSLLLALARTSVQYTCGPMSGAERAAFAIFNLFGTMFGAWIYGKGVEHDTVGLGWWFLCVVSLIDYAVSLNRRHDKAVVTVASDSHAIEHIGSVMKPVRT